jgi:hypothetical protein
MTSTRIFEISLEKMQRAFEQMQNEAGWDTKEKLYWGFYFLDHNLQKLEQFSIKLKDNKFYSVEIRKTDGDGLYLLHVEEYVSHSAKSLFEQCHKLAGYAIENEIDIFDGWDVEKEKMSRGLVE